MRCTHPRSGHQDGHTNAKVHLQRKQRLFREVDWVFLCLVTFWASSEQHESLHFRYFVLCCVMAGSRELVGGSSVNADIGVSGPWLWPLAVMQVRLSASC
jgi:hypothetical protein